MRERIRKWEENVDRYFGRFLAWFLFGLWLIVCATARGIGLGLVWLSDLRAARFPSKAASLAARPR